MKDRNSRNGFVLTVLIVTVTMLTTAMVSPVVAIASGPSRAQEPTTSGRLTEGSAEASNAQSVENESGNITTSFDSDDEGWQISGDAQGGGSTPEYVATGGSPGGHICADDNVAGGTWYFSAPTKFLGDRTDAYGGTLAFDINQSSTEDQFSQDDIVLGNETRTIVYDFGDNSTHPGANWTSYSVPIDAANPGWTDDSGGDVTATGFRSLLSNLSTLAIRGEYVSGSDRGCLDSVRLTGDERTTTGGDAAVRITSPTSTDEFARGDIIPIELAFENTDRGTITFGDRDAHNVEVNVTVRDSDGDGNGTIYLNTSQVGHGYLRNGSNSIVSNFDSDQVDSRNHGFFTVGDGTALEGEDGQSAIAHPGIDISGASQGGAVISEFSYDLSSVAGEQPFTEAGVVDDRAQVVVIGDVPGVFQVSNLNPASAEIESPGDSLEVSATISNTGKEKAMKAVRLEFDGSIQDMKRVTLGGGEQTTVNFSVDTSGLEPGARANFSVSTANGSQSGVVSVTGTASSQGKNATIGGDAKANDSEGEAATTDSSGPGFGIGIAMLAVVLTVLYGRLRSGDEAP